MLARKRKPARLPGDGSADQRELRTPPARRRQRLAILCIVALFALAMTNSPYAVTVLEPEPPPVLASPLMEPRMERPPPKPNPPDAVLLPPRTERDEIAAAPPSERQSCLSFRRGLCPSLDAAAMAPRERDRAKHACHRYVALERNLSLGTRFCGARLPRANPCWSEGGKRHCLPAFFILGEMKCGTTTLYALLTKHPSIVAPRTKEPRFLQPGRFVQTTLARYATNFEPAARGGADVITFDASPTYLSSTIARFWLARWLSDTRLIVLVRDPIQRAYSHWKMAMEWLESKCAIGTSPRARIAPFLPHFTFERLMERSILLETLARCARAAGYPPRPRRYSEPIRLPSVTNSTAATLSSPVGRCLLESDRELVMSFADELEGRWPPERGDGVTRRNYGAGLREVIDCSEFMLAPPAALKKGAMYASEIESWLSLFPSSQLKVIHTDDIDNNGARLINETFKFLGLPPVDVGGKTRFCVRGKAGVIDMQHARDHSLTLGAATPTTATTEGGGGAPLQIGDCAGSSPGARRHPVEPALEARLRRYYEPANRRLYRLLRRDLGW